MKACIVLAMGAFVLSGPTAKAQTLWQVWQAAQQHDPEFQAARAALAAAQAAHPEALAALLPQLTASANRTVDNQSSSGPEFYGSQIVPVSQSANTRATDWQLQLSQALFDWSAIKNVEAAGLDAASAAATYQSALATLAQKVVNAYLGVLGAQANLAATEATAKAFAEQYRQANARYRAGLSGIIGADASQAALATAEADVLDARQQLTAALATLSSLTVEPAVGRFPPLPLDYHIRVSGTENDWRAKALSGNPELAAARLTARANEARVGAAESDYLPNVSLALTHSHYSESGSSDYAVPGSAVVSPAAQISSDNTIALELSWNFYSGGATRARVGQARATADESAANAATTRLDIARQVQTDYAALDVDAAVIVRLRAAVKAARDAVTATEKAVPVGVRTEDDLVIQRERLLTTEQQLDSAVTTSIQDQIALARAAGELTPGRIQSLSERLVHTKPPTTSTTSPGAAE